MKQFIAILAFVAFCFATNAQNTRTQTGTRTSVPIATVPLEKPGDMQKTKVPTLGSTVFKKQKKLPDNSVINQTFTVSSSMATIPLNNSSAEVSTAQPIRTVLSTSPGSRTALGKEVCETVQSRISASNLSELSVDFSYSQQVANIYPGALYKFDDYYSGNWNAINYGRNPITLVASVKNNNGLPTQVVSDPGFANITNSVSQLFNRFTRNPAEIAQEGFRFNVYEVESQAEMAFRIGAAGHYFGVSASNMFSSNSKEKHKYLLIDATKEMFSISVQAPQNGLMIDPNTATPDMMYISNVTYGARVLACVELDTYDKEIADKFSGGANYIVAGGQVDVDTYLRTLGTTMKISFYAVGGNSKDATLTYSFDGVKQLCNNIIAGLNYQTAQPIKYQFKNMNNEVVLSSSATDNFLSQSCTLERDMKVTAYLDNIKLIQDSETDAEIFGQIWVQVFDKNGREIMPDYGKDRLFDVKDFQHLNQQSFWGSGYKPGISATFTIPKEVYAGSKILIYYWMMDDDDSPNDDDFLAMRNGALRKYNRNNLEYYVHEFYPGVGGNGKFFSGEFVDRDGESGIRVETMISIGPIPIPK